MNRLQILKRTLMASCQKIKNLLFKNWQSYVGTKQVTAEKLTNGIKGTVTSLSGGYNTLMHFVIFENPQWGKTYTLTCNIEESVSGMDNSLRIGYWRSDTTTWLDVKAMTINKGNGVYSVTFTLPTEQPGNFRVDYVTDPYFGGLRLFFNIQKKAGLTECGSITITDMVITQND